MTTFAVLRHTYPPARPGTKGASSIRLKREEEIDFLLSRAQPGDTLHKVSAEVAADPPRLFDEIARQLASGKFVRV